VYAVVVTEKDLEDFHATIGLAGPSAINASIQHELEFDSSQESDKVANLSGTFQLQITKFNSFIHFEKKIIFFMYHSQTSSALIIKHRFCENSQQHGHSVKLAMEATKGKSSKTNCLVTSVRTY
jgi:DNA gyrase/topoisomerase IV subunit B